MQQDVRVKVWKDRMAFPHPTRWCWEVVQRVPTPRIVGCGTTTSERASRDAAARIVDERSRSIVRIAKRRRFTPRIAMPS